jgi:hypothetical protein
MTLHERKRILIWGKTRPELSRSYRETVCTGGILADTRRLIRLYPIPLRFLTDESVFSKYQWIEADIAKSTKDYRPESYRIRIDSVVVGEKVPTEDNWQLRAEWVMNPQNLHASVEALQDAQKRDKTSLGIIKPKEFVDFVAEAVPDEERNDYWLRYAQVMAQPDLPFEQEPEQTTPLPPPDYRYRIRFRCDDPACTRVHDFGVFDWEADALYATCRRRGDTPEQARDKVLDKLRNVCGDDKDTHFFLGNIFSHQHVFTIVGLWYPKKRSHRQMDLFA